MSTWMPHDLRGFWRSQTLLLSLIPSFLIKTLTYILVDNSFWKFICISTWFPLVLNLFSINFIYYLSIHLPMYLPNYLSTYLSIYLSIFLPIYLSTYLSIHLFIHLHIYLFIYLSIYYSGFSLILSRI